MSAEAVDEKKDDGQRKRHESWSKVYSLLEENPHLAKLSDELLTELIDDLLICNRGDGWGEEALLNALSAEQNRRTAEKNLRIAEQNNETDKRRSNLALVIAGFSVVLTLLFSLMDYYGDKSWQEGQISILKRICGDDCIQDKMSPLLKKSKHYN